MKCKFENCKVKHKTKVPRTPIPEEKISVESRFEHCHTLKELDHIKNHGINNKVKELIGSMISNKVKTGKIEKLLKEYAGKGIIQETELPSANQLADLRRNERRKDTFIGTEAEFKQLIEELDPDKMKSESDPIIIGYNLNPDNFCMVFTSKHLLNNILRQAIVGSTRYLCLDGTYKLTVLEYPLLVFGTQDSSHKFKLLDVSLSRHERAEDYKFALELSLYTSTNFVLEYSAHFILEYSSNEKKKTSKNKLFFILNYF